MSITRHEIRQITDENRGQPIISQAVAHGKVAHFAGVTPNPIVGDIKTQTAQALCGAPCSVSLVWLRASFGTASESTAPYELCQVAHVGWPAETGTEGCFK